MDEHRAIIQSKKQIMENFLFYSGGSLKDHFKLWGDVLISKLDQDCFNSRIGTNQNSLDYKSFLGAFIDNLSEEEIRKWIDKVRPSLPDSTEINRYSPEVKEVTDTQPMMIEPTQEQPVIVAPASVQATPVVEMNKPIIYPGHAFIIIPTPYQNSFETAIQIGCLIHQNNELQNEVQETVSILKRNLNYRALYREGILGNTTSKDAKKVNSCLNNWKTKANQTLDLSSITVEIFKVEKDQYVLTNTKNPGQTKTIRLLFSNRTVKNSQGSAISIEHYDLLYPEQKNPS